MRVKNKIVSGLLAFMMLFVSNQNSLSWNAVWLELISALCWNAFVLLKHKDYLTGRGFWIFNFLVGSDVCYRFKNKQIGTEQNKGEIKKYKEKIEYYKNLYGSLDQYDENGKKIS